MKIKLVEKFKYLVSVLNRWRKMWHWNSKARRNSKRYPQKIYKKNSSRTVLNSTCFSCKRPTEKKKWFKFPASRTVSFVLWNMGIGFFLFLVIARSQQFLSYIACTLCSAITTDNEPFLFDCEDKWKKRYIKSVLGF